MTFSSSPGDFEREVREMLFMEIRQTAEAVRCPEHRTAPRLKEATASGDFSYEVCCDKLEKAMEIAFK